MLKLEDKSDPQCSRAYPLRLEALVVILGCTGSGGLCPS